MNGDPELLRQYAEDRSEAAFTELVHRHVDFVYGVALRHAHNVHRAEDVTQMVFADLARKSGSLSRRTELVGWLYTSTRYAAAKVVRAEVRREEREQRAQMIQKTVGENSPAIDWRHWQPVLDDTLQGLSERDRSALLLRFFRNLSFLEVGAALRVSEDAARKRVDRALEKLRRQLATRGITSTATALTDAMSNQITATAPATLAADAVAAALLARSAAVPGSLILKLLHLMSTSKAVATGAVIAGFLSIGAAYHEIKANQRVEAALAAANRRYDQLEDRIRNMRAPAAPNRSARPASPPVSATSPGGATGGRNLRPPIIPGTPELNRVGMKYARELMRQNLEPAFRSLGLSPAQIDTFLDARMSHMSINMNGVIVVSAPQAQGVATPDGLDPSLEQQLSRYQAEDGDISSSVAKLAGQLYDTDPLSPGLASQLQQVLKDNTPPLPGGARSVQNTNWPAVLSAAQEILSDAQLDVLRGYAMTRTGEDFGSGTAPNAAPSP